MRKTIKRWTGIAAGALALAVATPALAQDPDVGHGHDPEKRIEWLQETLDLSDAQVAELRTIFAEQAEKHRELPGSEDREAKHALRRETHERLAAVLTEEQREKLGNLREHGGEKHRRPDHEERHQDQPGEES